MSTNVTKASSIGFDVLKIALILGLLGDVLLRATPWGLNVLLFNLAFVAGFAILLWRGAPQRLTGSAVGLMAAQLFFAAMFVWRDSSQLHVADTFAIIAILSIQLLPQMHVPQRLAGVFHYVIGLIWSSFNAFFGSAALLAADIEWADLPRTGWRKHAFATLRGLAIATPLVLVFGGLFVAADAAYQGLVTRVLDIDPTTIFTHALPFAVFAWLSMGYLRGVLIRPIGAAEIELINDDGETLRPGSITFSDVAREEGELPVTLPDDRFVVDHLRISDPSSTEGKSTDPEPATDDKKEWKWADLNNGLLPAAFTLGTTEVAVILGLMTCSS